MKQPEREVLRKIVGEWLHKAELDISAAEALFSQSPPLLYPSCFHLQQAAEKYLKAFLSCHQVEFPKTHSIRELLNLVKTVDGDLASRLQPAAALTPYGVDIRYPGDAPEPDSEETQTAMKLARKVRDAVLSALKGCT